MLLVRPWFRDRLLRRGRGAGSSSACSPSACCWPCSPSGSSGGRPGAASTSTGRWRRDTFSRPPASNSGNSTVVPTRPGGGSTSRLPGGSCTSVAAWWRTRISHGRCSWGRQLWGRQRMMRSLDGNQGRTMRPREGRPGMLPWRFSNPTPPPSPARSCSLISPGPRTAAVASRSRVVRRRRASGGCSGACGSGSRRRGLKRRGSRPF
jgi:hypothetical protein